MGPVLQRSHAILQSSSWSSTKPLLSVSGFELLVVVVVVVVVVEGNDQQVPFHLLGGG